MTAFAHAEDSAPATYLLHEIIARAAGRHPQKPALMYHAGESTWQALSYRELMTTVARAAVALAQAGIGRGDRVAILAGNGPWWAVADLATLSRGAIVVPIYPSLPPTAVRHILADSESRLIFVGNATQEAMVEAIRGDLPALEKIVSLASSRQAPGDGALSFRKMIADAGAEPPPHLEDSLPASGEALATIVYTSGTTADPKGVALSHRNIAVNVQGVLRRFEISANDVFLSFLPASHMFERTCGHFAMLAAGATIAYARDLTALSDDARQVRPTIVITVPRILEKAYEAAAARVAASWLLRRHLVRSTIRVLNECVNRGYRGQPIGLSLRWRRALLDRLVAARFRGIAGGRLRLLGVGGAPLDRRLAKTLWVLGFGILEGYGLTEAAPLVAASSIRDNRLGTVGRPLEGIEVRIGPDNEVLVRGANVMTGYFRRPQETRLAIDPEGWLHTGDQGHLDERGHLVITGRLKEMIVTSYGKNVSPSRIEAALLESRYIREAMLCGDRRPYITALIVPAREAVEAYAGNRGGTTENPPAGLRASGGHAVLLEQPEIRELFALEIDRIMERFAEYERVKRFALLTEGFSVENGLLTPTLKMRRTRIAERYRDRIDALYGS